MSNQDILLKLESMGAILNDNKKKLDDIESDIRILKDGNSEIEGRLDNIEDKNSEIVSNIDDLEGRMTNADKI